MSIVRIPVVWAAVLLAAITAFVMMFAYLGAFVDPGGNTRHLPLVLVNQDQGVTVQGQRMKFGSDLTRRVLARQDPRLEWTRVQTRQQAVQRIGEDKAFGGLVIPANYTARLLALANPQTGAHTPAQLEILSNPAAGSIASATADTIVGSVVTEANAEMQAALVRSWTQAGVRPSLQQSLALGQPVHVQGSITTATSIGDRSARGLAPFYFAVMLTLAGLVGVNIISLVVEFLMGNIRLELPGLEGLARSIALSPAEVWRTKLILTAAMSVMAGLLQTWMAVGILGMPADNTVHMALFAILGILAIALITLTFLTALGTAGAFPAVLFTTIFGVPSAGGVYPLQMVPGFFQFLGTWLPLRYLTDGARSLAFFGGRTEAGLGTALWVLAGYVLGALILSGIIAMAYDRRARDKSGAEDMLPSMPPHEAEAMPAR